MKETILLLLTITIVAASAIYAFTPIDYEWETISYIVQSGDTLWRICRPYCPDSMDIRDYIQLIQEVNGKSSATIYVGEAITLLQAK